MLCKFMDCDEGDLTMTITTIIFVKEMSTE